MDFSFRLAARVLLYASSHRQDTTYHWRDDIPQEVFDGLFECLEIVEKSYQEFVETRFQDKEKHLHDRIPTNRKTVFVKRTSTPATAKKSMAKKDAVQTIRCDIV